VNKNARGCQLESGLVSTSSGSFRGFVKSSFSCNNSGNGEIEFHTDAGQESKANYKFNQLSKGLIISPSVSSRDKSLGNKSSGTFDLEYSQANFAATAAIKSDLSSHKFDGSLTVAGDGISVGGSASVDLTNSPELSEVNFGAQYQTKEFTASLFTEDNRNLLNASYYLNVNANQSVGAAFKLNVPKGVRTATFGTDYRLDAETNVKAKFDIASDAPTNSTFSLAVEHRLPNPAMLLSVATSFKTGTTGGNCCESLQFGLGVTLGDF